MGAFLGEATCLLTLIVAQQDAAAGGDGDRLVVERILQFRQAGIGTRRRRVELGRAARGCQGCSTLSTL